MPEIHRRHWFAAAQDIRPSLFTCMKRLKAECYKRVLRLRWNYWKQRNDEKNSHYDCHSYGNIFGACDEERTARYSADALQRYIPTQVQLCESL